MRAPRLLTTLVFLACQSEENKAHQGADDSATTPRESATNPSDSDGSTTDSTSDSPADSPTDSEPWSLPARPDTDQPGENESWRWGGGVGYPDVVDPDWPVVVRVSDLGTLSSALAAATAGTIVYVEDGAAIDLTGQSLCIPAGVWLASGRGVDGSAGGLLYATEGASLPILQACGDGVRVTGLRIRGPDPKNCPSEWPDACPNDVSGDSNCAYCTTTAYGVATFGAANLEVDNNEFSGWTYTAVGVKDAIDADVHHNHIHHGWREGLGYGVVLYGSSPTTALIRWNRFDAMRHVVAGQGYPSESYEARDNLMGTHAISHVYDMHGEDEANGSGNAWAGNDIRVHRNIVLVDDQYSLIVRGKPATGAWLYDNCLARSSSNAATQYNFYGNFYLDQAPDGTAAPNAYSQSMSDCGTVRWCIADGADGPLRYGSASGTPATDVLVGDLNGDGKDDVFNGNDGAWRWANPNGGSWASLATSGFTVDSLALADLDGDGIDDVFRADGSAWYWSKSGTASWATLKSSTYGLDEVGFGDFNGDGATDVFTTDGAQWSYHPNGSGAAINLATSGSAISALAFGDFDGDGITDVFTGDGSQWKWSRSGNTSWASLAVSSTTVASLAFADVDGDHITDVLLVSGYTLRYSSGGKTSWITLRYQQEELSEVRFGDFDGDGRADVFTGGCL